MKQDSPRESTVPRLKAKLRETFANAILAAAEEVLARDGLQGARMETIAATAGVAVGTVYNYFADRDALLEALIERRRIEMLAGLDRALLDAEKLPWASQLEAFIAALLSQLDAHRAFWAILMQGELLALRVKCGPKVAAGSPIADVRERVEKLMLRGVRKKVLRAADLELYPSLLLGMVRGVFIRSTYHPTSERLTDLVAQLARFFCEGARERKR